MVENSRLQVTQVASENRPLLSKQIQTWKQALKTDPDTCLKTERIVLKNDHLHRVATMITKISFTRRFMFIHIVC